MATFSWFISWWPINNDVILNKSCTWWSLCICTHDHGTCICTQICSFSNHHLCFWYSIYYCPQDKPQHEIVWMCYQTQSWIINPLQFFSFEKEVVYLSKEGIAKGSREWNQSPARSVSWFLKLPPWNYIKLSRSILLPWITIQLL